MIIEKITVSVVGDSEQVDVTIRWAGGYETRGRAVQPVARMNQPSCFSLLLACVTELAAAGHTHQPVWRCPGAAPDKPAGVRLPAARL